MNNLKDFPISILDLVPVREGHTRLEAMQNSLAMAQYAEALGYKRFWISEHHNTASLVSSATPVLLAYLAQGTKTIRVGSGGVMLPNHTPLIVAEQFGTLATLYPDRIDLGLGRAPGTDQVTAMALRRQHRESVDEFPNDVQELRFFLSEQGQYASVRAIPGEGLKVPIYLLGSSTFSAQLAAPLGLPYVFASHFAPNFLYEALSIYRSEFKPSDQCSTPYAMAGVNIVMAETDEEAQYLATTGFQFALQILRNSRQPLQPPVEDMTKIWTPYEETQIMKMRKYSFVGAPDAVRRELSEFISETGVNEIVVAAYIYDQEKRKKSFELLADLVY